MSNMYPEYEGQTINYVGGNCPWGCIYCYVNGFRYPSLKERYSGKPFLIESSFKRNLGKNKGWFVNSCSDINAIPLEWRIRIFQRLNEFPTNTYLIQSKHPYRFTQIEMKYFPQNTILGTTAETNRDYNLSKAPQPADRLIDLAYLGVDFPKMISIEPILDFDLDRMTELIRRVKPVYVSIGADSGNNDLIEPSPEKIEMLINELQKFTEVRIKHNLERLRRTI